MPRIVITPEVEEIMTAKAATMAASKGQLFDPDLAGRIRLPEGTYSIEISSETLRGLREVQDQMPFGSTLSDTILFLFRSLQ